MHLFSLILHKANNQLTKHFLYSAFQHLIYKSYLSLNEFYIVQKYMLQYISSYVRFILQNILTMNMTQILVLLFTNVYHRF